MKCEYCNIEIPEDAQKCPSCGAVVYQNIGNAPASGQQSVRNSVNQPMAGGSTEQSSMEGGPMGTSNQNQQSYAHEGTNASQYQGSANIINGTTYLVFSILCTIFCCFPFGIPAIVFASKINSLQQSGDYAGAQEAAKKAKLFTIIAAAAGVVVSLLYLGLGVAGALGSLSGYSY